METTKTDILSVGLIVCDIIVRGADVNLFSVDSQYCEPVVLACGGDAFNVAYNASKLGAKTALAGARGRDPWGDFLSEQASGAGIDINCIKISETLGTANCVVMVERSGARHFAYYPGTNDLLSADYVDIAAIDKCSILHIGGALALPSLDGDGMASLLGRAKSMGKTVTVDVTYSPDGNWYGKLKDCFPYIDIFMPSIGEASMICGSSDPYACVNFLLGKGVGNVIVKMGADGCIAADASQNRHFPAAPANVVDTTGAGDCFNAGFLAAYAGNRDFYGSVANGMAAAKICVENIGATGFEFIL